MTIKERIQKVLENSEIDESHWEFYLVNYNPDAEKFANKITNADIKNAIMAKELFWGLGDAIKNYCEWESKQL